MRARMLGVSLLAGLALLFGAGTIPASADPGGNNGSGTGGATTSDTQTSGNVTVRTETTTVVERDQRVRIIRIFRNDVLVKEVRTPLGVVAGFESGPTGQVIFIVEGMQSSAPSLVAEAALQGVTPVQRSAPVLSRLPSTSTDHDPGGLAIGLAAIGVGLAILRRRSVVA